jgi:hypothetical protein
MNTASLVTNGEFFLPRHFLPTFKRCSLTFNSTDANSLHYHLKQQSIEEYASVFFIFNGLYLLFMDTVHLSSYLAQFFH